VFVRYLSVAFLMAVLVGACTVDQDVGVGATATTARSATTSPTAAELDAAEARIEELERTVDRLRDENQELEEAFTRAEAARRAAVREARTSEPLGSCHQPDGEAGENQTVVLLYLICDAMTSDSTRVLAGLVPVGRTIADDGEVLTVAIRALLSGTTANEEAAGYSSWFSPATADALLSVEVDNNRATIDLEAGSIGSLNNVSTSTGGTYFRGQLYGTTFANAAVDSVEFRLDGDPARFCGLMELVPNCTPITLGEWNEVYTQAFEN
jgi:hypothetical protein